MRKKIVAGNWKMNLGRKEAGILISEIVSLVEKENVPPEVNVIICPSFVHLSKAKSLLPPNEKRIFLGAQNCSHESSGAFTGEVSAPMLNTYQVDYVIVGHSERRQYFKEDSNLLAEKVNIVLDNGMTPIFCCGEQLIQRETNQQNQVVEKQLSEALFHLPQSEFKKLVIAYEPVWAIGTGVTATSIQAQQMHATIRHAIAGKYGSQTADHIPILYGGSCKPTNAKELFAQEDVDGGLIGGASLKAKDFVAIMKSFSEPTA